jgi:hypothetical protein
MFKDCDISLASETPNLFRHLEFKRAFDLREESPNYDKYFLFDTITPPNDSNLVWCFMSHMLTNCVDFPSLCAFRLQLPTNEKDIRLRPKRPSTSPLWGTLLDAKSYGILIHPGRHWQSKTFPKSFWDKVIKTIIKKGVTPVLIGADTDDNRGTVNVDSEECLDLRNELSIEESIWLCMNSKVLLTNDSSPLHMAAPGRAWVGYIATCKHPDMISHWRNPERALSTMGVNELAPTNNVWNWREKNFSKGGVWDIIDFCPNKPQKVEAEFVPQDILESWLPDPEEYASWAVNKFSYPDGDQT